MESVACFLCGVQIRAVPRYPVWMWQYRAVYTGDGRSHPWDPSAPARISGVVQRQRDHDEVPVDSTENARTILISLNQNRLTRPIHEAPDGPAAQGFALHDSCWGILVAVRPREEVDPQRLLDVLRSFPVQNGVVNFGHTYGGIMVRRRGYVGREEEMVNTPIRGLQTTHLDPLDVPALRRFFTSGALFHAENAQPVARQQTSPVEVDPFAVLPEETLTVVFDELCSTDVVHLRQASRVCANTLLRDSFWKSRFLPGREFGYIFEAREHVSVAGRWKSLYLLASVIRESPDVVNRRRVWGLAHSLRGLLDEASEARLLGDPDRSRAGGRDKWITASRALCPPEKDFMRGARALWTRRVSVPREVSVWFSSVNIHGTWYISGIQFEEEDGEQSDLGYVSTPAVAPAETIDVAGFHLALDERGVRGVAVVSSTGQVSKWIGDHAGIPKRRLVLGAKQGAVRYVEGGFDALKLVSLALSDGSERQGAKAFKAPLRDSVIWYPEIPDACLSITGIDPSNPSDPETERPAVLAVYGGVEGARLDKVSSISVRYSVRGEYKGRIMGLKVSFADGAESVKLGAHTGRPVTTRPYDEVVAAGGFEWLNPVGDEGDDGGEEEELRFEIDGRGGERITGVSVSSRMGRALKIDTSKGRVAMFPPGDELVGETHSRFVRLPTMGRTIVGFCSRVCPSRGLGHVGLVSTGEATRG